MLPALIAARKIGGSLLKRGASSALSSAQDLLSRGMQSNKQEQNQNPEPVSFQNLSAGMPIFSFLFLLNPATLLALAIIVGIAILIGLPLFELLMKFTPPTNTL